MTVLVAGYLTGGVLLAAAQENKVLFLGIFQDGQLLARPTSALADKLRGRYELVPVEDLADKERRCDKPSCIEHLTRKLAARFAIWGRVLRSSQSLLLQAYDTQTSTMDDEGCSLHEGVTMEECVHSAGPTLLRRLQSPIEGVVIRTHKPILDGLGASPSKEKQRVSIWRASLATTFGLLGVLSLAGAIPLTVLNGQPADGVCSYNGMKDTCVWNLTGLFSAGYSIAAVSIVGLGLTLGVR